MVTLYDRLQLTHAAERPFGSHEKVLDTRLSAWLHSAARLSLSRGEANAEELKEVSDEAAATGAPVFATEKALAERAASER